MRYCSLRCLLIGVNAGICDYLQSKGSTSCVLREVYIIIDTPKRHSHAALSHCQLASHKWESYLILYVYSRNHTYISWEHEHKGANCQRTFLCSQHRNHKRHFGKQEMETTAPLPKLKCTTPRSLKQSRNSRHN